MLLTLLLIMPTPRVNGKKINPGGILSKEEVAVQSRLLSTLNDQPVTIDNIKSKNDELSAIRNGFNNIVSKVVQESDKLGLHPVNSNNDVLILIQNATNNLKNGFLQAMANEITLNDAIKWENTYKDLLTNSRREIDNIRDTLTEEDKNLATDLLINMKVSVKSANKLRELLENYKPHQNLYNGEVWTNKTQVFEEVKQFCMKYSEKFSPILEQLITKGYANDSKSADDLMNVCMYLPDPRDTSACLTFLYFQIKQNQRIDSYELITLAYKVKEFTDNPKINTEYKYQLNSLKNDLPKTVQNLLWNGQNCILRNKHWGEYLFAARGFDYDASRGRVFSRTQILFTDEQENWIFEPRDNGKVFAIKNSDYGQYFYPAADDLSFSSERRRVFIWKRYWLDPGSWKIKTVDNGKYITLLSKDHNEYLFADREHVYGMDKRRVFTWRSCETPDWLEEDYRWELIC